MGNKGSGGGGMKGGMEGEEGKSNGEGNPGGVGTPRGNPEPQLHWLRRNRSKKLYPQRASTVFGPTPDRKRREGEKQEGRME